LQECELFRHRFSLLLTLDSEKVRICVYV
jgi:hypothetical protein